MAPQTTSTSSQHSPYGTPVIPLDLMSEATRQYYSSLSTPIRTPSPTTTAHSSGASDDAGEHHHHHGEQQQQQLTGHAATSSSSSAHSATPQSPQYHGQGMTLSRGRKHPMFLSPPSHPSYMKQPPPVPPVPVFSGVKSTSRHHHHHTHQQLHSNSARSSFSFPYPAATEQQQQQQQHGFPLPPALMLAQKGTQRLSDPSYVSSFRPDLQHQPIQHQQQHAAAAYDAAAAPSQSTFRAIAHAELMGKVTFFPFPTNIDWVSTLELHNDNRAALHCVFLGQVRFEANDREIAWVIRTTSGVSPVHVEIRARGCWLVYVATAEEAEQVLATHRHTLYDHSGIWYAADEAQTQSLSTYLRSEGRQPVPRLPRDAVIIEPAVPMRRGSGSAIVSSPPRQQE